jgi:uncharacterized protein YhaN
MRFAELTLERYGRFEDCKLVFRPGEPDLHVIYGANEAGKSTTLSAVSDLLFGFPPRSPYNFRFDYGLLRVGAVLEDEGQRLICRRRKAQSQSLIDAEDRPIDEGLLLAMLRGQQREPFRLGFSLDQTRLREGGRAMVDARNDLGQALFAAGSGMTEVASVLADLRQEADEIWGPRAAARRAYTIAERQLTDAQHRLRDLQLRPKAWTDARHALERDSATLELLQRERSELAQERRRLERLRRIGPDARKREQLLADLEIGQTTARLTPEAEASAASAFSEFERAERDRAAAATLLIELEARIEGQGLDAAPLAVAEDIEALGERRGAEQKAAIDAVRLKAELAEKLSRGSELRREVGASASVPRSVVARLRELAGRDAELRSRLTDANASRRDAESRAEPLRQALADTELDERLPDLVSAVDAARALGADLDARCDAQVRELKRLQQIAAAALERLAPWAGELEALWRVPLVSPDEIDAAQAALARAREDELAAATEDERLEEEVAGLALERRAMTGGGIAVPAEALTAARAVRDEHWTSLRTWLFGGPSPSDPKSEVDAFEVGVAEADALADRRFASAAASGRLAALDANLEKQALARAQAQSRRARAAAEAEALIGAWLERLAAAGLPSIEPVRLRAWLQMRQEAIDAAATVERAGAVLNADLNRRAEARARLLTFIPSASTAAATDTVLAPLLDQASRLRREGEGRNARFTETRAELRGLEDRLAEFARNIDRATAERSAGLVDWERELAGVGLVLPIDGAEHRLALLEELRAVEEAAEALKGRIEGIDRDAQTFAADVNVLADTLGLPPDGDSLRRLDGLRRRLTAARSAADAHAANDATRTQLQDRVRSAEAAKAAATAGLAPRLAELGLDDVARLPECLDASRTARRLNEELAETERRISDAGDGYVLVDLIRAFSEDDPDALAGRMQDLDQKLGALDAQITEAADAVGSARRAFEGLEASAGGADAAQDIALARAELDTQAELYILKRAQELALRWALDRYRERRQNPLLARASELFRTLTLGRYLELRVDLDSASPRLLGLCDDRASLVEVDHMSEGTSDQLFLALRLAAVEQTIGAGVRLPFLADDLFVNFDDARAKTGLRVLTELARSTQVLIFTHHAHLVALAREVAGADTLSECQLR